MCRQPLSHCSDHVVVFGCGHGYHSACLGEPKSCYKCLNTKGWAPVATNVTQTVPQPPSVSRNSDVSSLFYISYTIVGVILLTCFTEKETTSSARIPTSQRSRAKIGTVLLYPRPRRHLLNLVFDYRERRSRS